ncbi:hypothetical protein [Streptomyces chromofuscus]|nr:hypothetical protein [Streptomyces chromofuscus]
MDRPIFRDSADTGFSVEEGTPAADSAPRVADRTERDPQPHFHAGLAQPEKWLIGVPFRPSASRVIWMYYVVDEAHDVPEAVHAAMERANSAQERRARGGIPATAEHIEVRRITVDAVGRTCLDGSW